MRGLALLLLAGLGSAGCGSADNPLRGFLTDAAQRRQALVASLWFQDNQYARLRLAHYANPSDSASWQRLPEWLPQSVALRSAPAAGPPRPLPLPALTDDSEATLQQALRDLGEAAFFDYPAQLVGGFELVLGSPALLEAYGLWRGLASTDAADAAPRLGGLIQVELPNGGGTALALSCASCHARAVGPRVEPGWPAAQLDLGALAQDQAPPGVALAQGRWGPGRVDVSPDGADNPVVIPDLRVVSQQRYLHHEATVRNDAGDPSLSILSTPAPPLALAVRIETLLITTLSQQARPPAMVALGLAVYLRSLALPPAAPTGGRGQELFAANCQRCHAPPDYAGDTVALAEIGTDAAAARSPERGTGTYRVPTLRAVSTRGALLHDGRLRDLASLLSPARLAADYKDALHGDGPVPGHPYGLDLSSADRDALLAFLQTL